MAEQNQSPRPPEEIQEGVHYAANPNEPLKVDVVNNVAVHMRPEASQAGQRKTSNQLWKSIGDRTHAIAFDRYSEFIYKVLCTGKIEAWKAEEGCDDAERKERHSIDSARKESITAAIGSLPRPLQGVEAYQILKSATELFLLRESGVYPDPEPPPNGGVPQTIMLETLHPYLKQVLEPKESETCALMINARLNCPLLLELIWSYWHEEGMLVQTISAIARRFQNRSDGDKDPLKSLEIGYLRPLANLLWGYIQDEHNRLTLPRRAYEYAHHYGFSIVGKAVPDFRPADCRCAFLGAFHTVLNRAAEYYRQSTNTMVIPDAFPLLEAIRDTQLVLSENMHNQYGDLTWTARVEMLIQKWLLSRPELRQFLPTREAVIYDELWMGPVDAMKTLQGWIDFSVRYFRDLAESGERLLLTLRFGNWRTATDADAKTWADDWRQDVQRYIHAYRVVTGVDLGAALQGSGQINTTPPSTYLLNRIRAQATAKG